MNTTIIVRTKAGNTFLAFIADKDWIPMEAKDIGKYAAPTELLEVKYDQRWLFCRAP